GGVEDLRHQCVHNPDGAGVTISGGFPSGIAKLQNLFKIEKYLWETVDFHKNAWYNVLTTK
ncbi:MAG: hypothetical protein SOT89_03310, partial [Clostridiaceae bacterium]|nr:hypothetical protein [Clostridiaceae bacterium]